MERQLRTKIRKCQELMALGGFIKEEAEISLSEPINLLCKEVCSVKEVPCERLFIPTSRVVRISLSYYEEQRDGELADYLNWFAETAVNAFLKESKEKDHYHENTHDIPEEKAMESIFPMERYIIKAALKQKTQNAYDIFHFLQWDVKYAVSAVDMAIQRYAAALEEIEIGH